jgi:hypothetical protein
MGALFDPPLKLKDHIVVRTLDDAVAFTTSYRSKRPMMQESVLRWLERADAEHGREAAAIFRGWAIAEKLMMN